MAPTPTYDFVVVGGFHAPDDHAKSQWDKLRNMEGIEAQATSGTPYN